MPWTVDNPPNPAKNKPKRQRRACVAAANRALRNGKTDEEAIRACIGAMNNVRSQSDMNVEYFDSELHELKVLKENNEPEGTFSGLAATFGNKDLDGDIIERGAFTETLKKKAKKEFRLLWQHQRDEPIGILKDLFEDEKGLNFKAQLAVNTTRGHDAYEFLKIGAIDRTSIGFMVNQDGSNIERRRGKLVRIIKSVDLWEISLVTFPANPKARVSNVKYAIPYNDLPLADSDYPWSSKLALRRVKEWAGASELPNDEYKKAFLWFDEEWPDDFESYKFLIADVVDGELVAVPRALKHAAASVMGIFGDEEIDKSHVNGIKRQISGYFQKMREEFSEEDLIPPWEREVFQMAPVIRSVAETLESKYDTEVFLRKIGFSRQISRAMASNFVPRTDVVGRKNRRDAEELEGNIVNSLRELRESFRR